MLPFIIAGAVGFGIAKLLEKDETGKFADGGIIDNLDDFDPLTTTTIIGDADFSNSKITDLGNLQTIEGDASFYNSQVENLGNLQTIGGTAYFSNSKITDLGNLTTIGGSADFGYSKITDLGNLQTIGGDAYFGYRKDLQAEWEKRQNKKYAGGGIIDNLDDFDPLTTTTINGDVDFSNSKITDLGNLQTIEGGANFMSSQIENLGNLQTIEGYAYFRDSQIENLGNLQTIGGYADFEESKVENLGNLQTIGGGAYFGDSQITDLKNLQTIGGNAYFEYSQIKNLGNLQTIGGDAIFSGSQVKDLGNLQTIEGDADFSDSQVENLGNLQTIGGDAEFYDSQVENLGNLTTIGDSAYFQHSQVKNLGNLQTIVGNADFRNSQITDLGNLQTIGVYADFGRRTDLKAEWEKRQNKKFADGGTAGKGLSKKEKSIVDRRIDYYFENNEYTDNSEELAYFVMESGMIDSEKYGDVLNYIINNLSTYAGGGETYNEKYKQLKGGVEYYSVDYDDVNGQEYRDDTFNTEKKAKAFFDEMVKSGMSNEEVPIDNIQLIEVYRNGDYEILYSNIFGTIYSHSEEDGATFFVTEYGNSGVVSYRFDLLNEAENQYDKLIDNVKEEITNDGETQTKVIALEGYVKGYGMGWETIKAFDVDEYLESFDDKNFAGGGSADYILSLYKKDKFSKKDSELIEEAIENGDIYTDDIKEDFMSYAYDKIDDKYEPEQIWEYTDENYENGLTHKESYDNLIEYLGRNKSDRNRIEKL